MNKILSYFVLSPRDVGMEPHTLDEIASIMKKKEPECSDGLESFVELINKLFEKDKINKSSKVQAGHLQGPLYP